MSWLKKSIIIFVIVLICSLGSFLVFYRKINYVLNGEKEILIKLNETYEELGVHIESCSLFKCKDISEEVKIEGEVNNTAIGEYQIKYIYEDIMLERTVKVIETIPPIITLKGEEEVSVCPNTDYEEEGYEALDNFDGDLTERVEVSKTDTGLLYKVSDRSGNKAEKTRKINYQDIEKPVIKLKGESTIYIELNSTYKEPGYSVVDNCGGNLLQNVKVTGEVDTNKVGTYKIEYKVKDYGNNENSVKRTVVVYDLESENLKKYEENLENYIKARDYNVSIGYYNIGTGYTYKYRANTLYYGASLIKTVDAMYVYEKMKLTNELKNLVKKAISVSDNAAHKTLIENKIGFDKLRKYGVGLGAKNTLRGSDNFGMSTVNDQLVYLKHLDKIINNNENGEELKSYFLNDFHNHLKFSGSPQIMHKYGYYGSYFHDVGIVLDNEPYIVVIMTLEAKSNYAKIISDLSEKIYELHKLV